MKAILYTRHPLLETFGRAYYEMTNRLIAERKLLRPVDIKPNLNILLADDDDDDREFFSEVISEIAPKVTVKTVQNGAQVLDYMNLPHAVYPDVIFLDLNMPFMDGKECLKLLKKDPRFHGIPVIIYSTSSNTKDIENAYQDGADYYITKPNTAHELRKAVKKVFSIDWANYFFHSPFERSFLK